MTIWFNKNWKSCSIVEKVEKLKFFLFHAAFAILHFVDIKLLQMLRIFCFFACCHCNDNDGRHMFVITIVVFQSQWKMLAWNRFANHCCTFCNSTIQKLLHLFQWQLCFLQAAKIHMPSFCITFGVFCWFQFCPQNFCKLYQKVAFQCKQQWMCFFFCCLHWGFNWPFSNHFPAHQAECCSCHSLERQTISWQSRILLWTRNNGREFIDALFLFMPEGNGMNSILTTLKKLQMNSTNKCTFLTIWGIFGIQCHANWNTSAAWFLNLQLTINCVLAFTKHAWCNAIDCTIQMHSISIVLLAMICCLLECWSRPKHENADKHVLITSCRQKSFANTITTAKSITPLLWSMQIPNENWLQQ